jgi:DNA-binding CsgD family transcriptional regulator
MTAAAVLDVPGYAEQATRRLSQGVPATDWRDVVEKGLAAAYAQSDAAALTSMVQVVAHLLDAQGRFEDALSEIEHALVFAAAVPDAAIILQGLKAAVLAAPGRFAESEQAIRQGERHLGAASPVEAIRFRIYRQIVRWQSFSGEGRSDVEDLLALTASLGLRRDRTFLLTWYVPFLATAGRRRQAHPWIRAIRLEAEQTRSRWRVSDAAAFEAWDEFLREPEERRGPAALDQMNGLSVWRGESVRLRDAALRRDARAAESALDALRKARKRVGSADMGGVDQLGHAARWCSGDDAGLFGPPPSSVSLNNLGAWLAEAEAVAMQGSQRTAGEWLAALSSVVPQAVSSSLEWPVSVFRIRAVLALRAGLVRQARSELADAIDWARSVGALPEEGLSLLQMGELCANADLRVAERTWRAQRAEGLSRLRMLGYDPFPHAYAIAHSLTLSSRNRLAERLTRREVDVLARLCDGMTYQQAALSLGIRPPTVQTLAHRAYQKLGVSGRHEAVLEARRLGVL